MDNYCVGDLNHLDDTSVNLFDPKDSTIKNEKYIYFKTEDCKIEENDVLVSKSTHGLIENFAACKSTDGVANLKNEFISEDCAPDETVAVKIEITNHTLEFGTIQELENICRTYSENVADEGTETSQISSKIRELDKTDGKKMRKKTRDHKGKVQTNTLDTFLHKAIGGVKKRKRTVSDGLFVRLERIDISDKLLSNLDNSTSSTTSSARSNSENNLGIYQETPKGLKLNKLPRQVGNSHQLNIKKPKYTINETESLKHLVRKELICDKCNLKVKTKRNLVTHQLIHSKAKQFRCPKCTYKTHYKNRMKLHLKYHEDNFQSCPECLQMVQERSFYDHIRNHRKNKLKVKKKCPECGKEVIELSKHLLIHKGDQVRRQCAECSFSAVNRRILKRHIQRYHEEQESFICYHCNKESASKDGLRKHLRAVHMDDPCECHICGKKLMSKLYLSAHVRKMHNNVKWFECDLCPEETRYRTKHLRDLKRHSVLHLNKDEDKLFHCDSCTYQTNVRQAIVHHVYRAHVPNDQKPSFKCKLCPYEGKLKGNLQVHINQVHLRNTKTRKCDQCDWEGYSSNFSRHIRTKHLGEEFICDKCNYKSNRKTNLISHQLVHSKVKQFSCPNCTYQTNYKSTLKAHLKYHEDNIQSSGPP